MEDAWWRMFGGVYLVEDTWWRVSDGGSLEEELTGKCIAVSLSQL